MLKLSELDSFETEGASGMKDLASLANRLEYKGAEGDAILNMLEDSPGMIEVIYQFVLHNRYCYRHLIVDDTED